MHYLFIRFVSAMIGLSISLLCIGCVGPIDENDHYSELESVWQYLKAYSIYQWEDSTTIPDDPFVFNGPAELMAAIPDTFTGSDGSFGRYTEYLTSTIYQTIRNVSTTSSGSLVLGKNNSTTTESLTVFLDTLTDSTVRIKIESFHSGEVDYDNRGQLMQWDVTSETFNSLVGRTKNFPYLILDLRGNGGGSIEESINIIEAFLPYGTEFLNLRERTYNPDTKTSQTVNHRWTSEGSPFPELSNKKITLLMNKRTASASEIVAAALKDCRDVILAGDTSYGKGIGQIMLPRIGRPTLKITFLQMSGLSNRTGTYHKKGIAPDVYIPDVTSDPKALLTAVKIHEPTCTSLRKTNLRKIATSPSPIAGYRIVYE